ncbi:ATP synthase subunit b, sodium ion specific [Peptoclostridium acidaminophilum DSM 3953]|uniref:ATP synthase subunit b n=1 Tax=Peptoclostridium acidaminophilum DSM 3953 TaxID=1286171 RepID=W8U409_PEPAC|nr:F0F1 ATP synthase subunit B [Peptoclostridium acidaminophilum]AHM55691.1 ATP synthase subunit b, sodium ion specific [Peptoclostridium acidaminophilum DSM 3953]
MENFKPFIGMDFELIAQWANTLIMFLIIKKLLFKPVTAFMENRKLEVAGAFTEAEEATAKANQMRKEYELKIEEAKEEAREIVKDANLKAQNNADDIIKGAHEEAKRLAEKAQVEIARDRQKVLNELKDEISGMAVMAASKIIQKDIDKTQHEKLINDFIQEVGEAKWQN